MNFLGAVFTLAAVAVGIVLLVPVVGLALAIACMLGGVLIWLLPILIIAVSDKVSRAEKLLWVLAIVFLSWFAWILYFFFAPVLDPPRRETYY